MVSFRIAAIKILKDAKKSLHYEEITKQAIEKDLIETSGATPEATMNAVIGRDIKFNKEKSPFIKEKQGFIKINPKYSEVVLKKEEKEEHEEDLETKSTQYIGSAGEHRVVSELLFRGYNASIMSVDEGLDIVATKDNQLFNIQVKTSNENKFNTYVSDIRKISFDKFGTGNTFYIFVLRGIKESNFLILSYQDIMRNVKQGYTKMVNKDTRYRMNISIRDGNLYVGRKENNMSYYLNNWELIK